MENEWWRAVAQIPGEVEPVTMRQVVAYNIREGRRARRLTQEQLCDRLAEVTGKTWVKSMVSAAESSWRSPSQGVRRVDPGDVVVFAIALRLPIAWFFLPPPEAPTRVPGGPSAPMIAVATESVTSARGIPPELLAWLALATSDDHDDDNMLARRLRTEQWRASRDADSTKAGARHLPDLLRRAANVLEDQLSAEGNDQ